MPSCSFYKALTGVGVCAESALYGSSPSVRVTEWAPGANDILDALTQLGYKPAQLSSNGRQTKKNAAKTESMPAPKDSRAQAQLLNVALLLRLLKAVCQAKVNVKQHIHFPVLRQACPCIQPSMNLGGYGGSVGHQDTGITTCLMEMRQFVIQAPEPASLKGCECQAIYDV